MRVLHTSLRPFASRKQLTNMDMTEIISKNEERATAPEMIAAIKQEVNDLLRRGTFKVILREELPDGANAITARFVLAIKSTADG